MRVIILLICLLFSNINVQAESKYIYDDNQDIELKSVEEFLSSKKLPYLELENENLNIKEKLLYKDLENVIKKEVNSDYLFSNLNNIYNFKHPNVSPNRQVYLFCSIKNTDKSLEHKYIIIDAETSETIGKGEGKAYKEK